MTKPFTATAMFTAATVLCAGVTTADTISNVSIIEATQFGTNDATDSATNGTASVNDFNGSLAVQNADGTSEVAAFTPFFGGQTLTTSTASFTQSETNTTAASRDYTLDYSLTEQAADFNQGFFDEVFVATALSPVPRATPSLGDNPFASTDPSVLPVNSNFTAASFEYSITVNDVLVFNARADALMDSFNPSAGLIFDAVSGFTPTATANNRGGFTFSVGAIADSISLGPVASGETLNVVSTLVARAYTPGFLIDANPISVNTFSADPVNLSSLGTLSSTPTVVVNPPVAAVPLPAAAWMLLAALGSLGAVRSRKA